MTNQGSGAIQHVRDMWAAGLTIREAVVRSKLTQDQTLRLYARFNLLLHTALDAVDCPLEGEIWG